MSDEDSEEGSGDESDDDGRSASDTESDSDREGTRVEDVESRMERAPRALTKDETTAKAMITYLLVVPLLECQHQVVCSREMQKGRSSPTQPIAQMW